MEEIHIIDEDFLISLEKEIKETNQILLQKLGGVKDILSTPEFIKITFSNYLLEDVKFLNMLCGKENFQTRHGNIIIRDMLEQVIEFIYIIKNKQRIIDFVGGNLKLDDEDLQSDLVDSLLKYGKRRYADGRPLIFKMVEDINEKISSDEKLSLHDMYRILSERSHNSYFNAMLEDIGEVETEERDIALTKEQITYIQLIINCFIESYRQ